MWDIWTQTVTQERKTVLNQKVNRDVQSFACWRLVSGGDGGRVVFDIFRFPHSSKRVTSFVTDTSVGLLFEILRHLLLLLSLQIIIWIVLTSDLFVTAFKHNNRIFKLFRGGAFNLFLGAPVDLCDLWTPYILWEDSIVRIHPDALRLFCCAPYSSHSPYSSTSSNVHWRDESWLLITAPQSSTKPNRPLRSG